MKNVGLKSEVATKVVSWSSKTVSIVIMLHFFLQIFVLDLFFRDTTLKQSNICCFCMLSSNEKRFLGGGNSDSKPLSGREESKLWEKTDDLTSRPDAQPTRKSWVKVDENLKTQFFFGGTNRKVNVPFL